MKTASLLVLFLSLCAAGCSGCSEKPGRDRQYQPGPPEAAAPAPETALPAPAPAYDPADDEAGDEYEELVDRLTDLLDTYMDEYYDTHEEGDPDREDVLKMLRRELPAGVDKIPEDVIEEVDWWLE